MIVLLLSVDQLMLIIVIIIIIIIIINHHHHHRHLFALSRSQCKFTATLALAWRPQETTSL